MGELVKFQRDVNGICVEQRITDGFVNATAMAVAHQKDISDWLKTDDTWELVEALAEDLGIKPKTPKNGNSVYTRVSACYPSLVVVKRGSPVNGGGTWIHPDLAVDCARWCNKRFALQVDRWVKEWIKTGQNPIQLTLEQEWEAWEQRHNIRLRLKDYLRVELMDAVIDWSNSNKKSPKTFCSKVHDLMNERIQGYKSKDIKALGGLPMAALIRDYFAAAPLLNYAAINQLAKNYIVDQGLDPVKAVNKACDDFLGKEYQPKLVRIEENLYKQGQRLKAAKKKNQLQQGMQLNLFGDGLVS